MAIVGKGRMSEAKQERKFEVQNGLRVLREADELRKNGGLMRDIKKEAKAQVKTLNKFTK